MDFSSLSERLQTFTDWPKPYISTYNLAKNGFYYKGLGDKVCCYSCKINIFDWNKNDIIEEEHFRLSPNCMLAKNIIQNLKKDDNIQIIPQHSNSIMKNLNEDIKNNAKIYQTQFYFNSEEIEDQHKINLSQSLQCFKIKPRSLWSVCCIIKVFFIIFMLSFAIRFYYNKIK
jgi:Inhibitor of Apoptosis domain